MVQGQVWGSWRSKDQKSLTHGERAFAWAVTMELQSRELALLYFFETFCRICNYCEVINCILGFLNVKGV